ncbi:MAG: TonB-dependent receptor [Campylobacterota bacterium]|nr:TonB-dependent receptor [Campylobacterota bacterium]
MKVLFLLTLLSSLLFSQELMLDNLLKEYEDSASLYKKTKKESAGYLLVYSREDLEKMQAFTLMDVLKTVRMYTIQVKNIGISRMQKAGAGPSTLPPIKLYIDDFEVTTVAQGNALDMYGEMDIYFVNHIEIYQGGSSIAFGNSPGSMVIRLYSKDPSRENSSSAQLSVDSKSSVDLRAVSAGTMGEYEYLLYADGSNTNFDKPTRNNQELSRDSKRYQAHFKVAKKDDFEVVVDAIANQTDMFSGMGPAATGDDSNRNYGYINAIKHFDGDIRLSVAASLETKKFFNSDAIGIKQPDNTLANNIDVHVESNTYKVILDKKILQGKHDFLIGAQFQQNRLNVKTYEGINVNPTIGPDKLDMYMFYIEELYNINENHLLAFSGKLDHYRDSFSKNSTEYAIRLGYIALLSDSWKTKLFAVRRYAYPNMLQTTFTPTCI